MGNGWLHAPEDLFALEQCLTKALRNAEECFFVTNSYFSQ